MHQKSFFPRKSPRDLRQINNKYPELTNCRPLSVYQPPTISKTYRLRSSFSLSCFLYRHLDDGEPFCWIFLIPDPIDVDGAGITCDLVALFLQEGEEFDIVVVQFLIRTEDLQAGSQRHLRNLLELDQRGVRSFAGDRLAVLDVDVLRLVASVFYGVTVTLENELLHYSDWWADPAKQNIPAAMHHSEILVISP